MEDIMSEMTRAQVIEEIKKARRLSLTRVIDLARANLGYVDLNGVNLSYANLSGSDMGGAILRGSDLSFADLADANLYRAEMEESTLDNADLSDSFLVKAKLRGSSVMGAVMSRANLYEADLRMSKFVGTSLTGAKLGKSDFSESDFRYVNLSEADLVLSNAYGADMTGSSLSGARFINANLKKANLSKVDLADAKLGGADLRGADLHEANLSHCDLTDTNLSHANLSLANLNFANLSEAKVDGANLNGAFYPEGPVPEGWSRDESGSLYVPTSPYPHSSYGASTGPLIKARKSVGSDPSSFKRRFPVEADRIKHVVKGRQLSRDVVAEVESSVATRDDTGKPLVWLITKEDYRGAQMVSDMANVVAKFNINMSEFDEEKAKMLSALANSARRSGHPFEEDPLFTVGWVRYLNLPDVILIEEVQSDVETARKGLSSHGSPDAEEQARKLGFFQPYADAFYYDAVGTIFQIADVEGKPVEMLSFKQKQQYGSPRSVYEDLPRKMGMKKVPSSSFNMVQGDVWYYKPNRRRR